MKERRPADYWEDICNVILEAEFIKSEHGFEELPGQPELNRLGYSSLPSAMSKYHEGSYAFRKLLGEKPKKIPDGFWRDLEYTLEQARKIIDEMNVEVLPSEIILRAGRHSGLVSAIRKYHGGMNKFRQLLGERTPKKPPGYWKELGNVLLEIESLKREHVFEELPGMDALNELGYFGLTNAIQTYHGGFKAFRQLLQEHQGQPTERQQLEGMLETYVEEVA